MAAMAHFFHLPELLSESLGANTQSLSGPDGVSAGGSCYPLVNIQKAIEHGHRNSGFPIKNGDFP